MPGELRGDKVLIPQEREASPLYNKGAFGFPQSGGALLLDLVEATYLAETNRLSVREGKRILTPEDLLMVASERDRDFEIRYLVYRDLRSRGYLVKQPGEAEQHAPDFHVYPRGGFPGKTPSNYVVHAVSERAAFRAGPLARAAERAHAQGKKLLVAIVDEEGDLTYYRTALADPKGRVPAALKDLGALRAMLLADRVVAFGKAAMDGLRNTEHYGHPLGFGLQLGFAETLYLMEHAGLKVQTSERQDLTPETFRERARELQDDFDLRYRVFCDLRERSLVGKTGFKFGTHFRAYEERPDEEHAPYLVHAVPEDYLAPWPEVSGFVRLAHGVRKSLVFAVVRETGAPAYLELERTRP
ncbi:MAG TPA: tRNA-intron lyase [Candidatus Thermoplasmatota archaeon]|nr:tRNA-intron lyase [Candidatus Thermoplasmatota archaeon]